MTQTMSQVTEVAKVREELKREAERLVREKELENYRQVCDRTV